MRISIIAHRLFGLFIVGLVSVPGLAGAAPVTFTFEADITTVGDMLQPISTTAVSGQKLTGRITYDTAVPGKVTSPTRAFYYNAVTELSLNIEPLGLAWNYDIGGTIEVHNDQTVGDEVDLFGLYGARISGPSVGPADFLMNPHRFSFELKDFDQTGLDSLALPEDLELSDFEKAQGVIEFRRLVFDPNVPGGIKYVAQVVKTEFTSLEYMSVSEPMALATLGLGLAGLALARRKRAE